MSKISPLTDTQRKYLETLYQVSVRIVHNAPIHALSPLVDATELVSFTGRLQRLPDQLHTLLTTSLLVINDSLSEAAGAMASTRDTPPWSVESVQLRSSLLNPNTAQTEVGRVRTLLHEVSHTLLESTGFPVKDYAYANGWAITQLGSLSPFNADTYAEVVALMADAGSPKPSFSRSLSIPRAQQAVFQSSAPTASLSAALALVDLRINRAHLRTVDYSEFAATLQMAAAISSKDTDKLDLMAIETQLQKWKIIGTRGWWSSRLDEKSIAQAKALENTIEQVKGWLTFLRVRLVTTPELLFETEGQGSNPGRRLDVPRAQLSHIPATELADRILVLMLNNAIAASNMTDDKKDLLRLLGMQLINLLTSHDREQERKALADRLPILAAVQVNAVLDDATWRGVQITAQTAALGTIAENWERCVAVLDEPEYKASPVLSRVRPRDVDTVKALIADLTGFALPANDPHAQARDHAVATLKTAAGALPAKFANTPNSKLVSDLAAEIEGKRVARDLRPTARSCIDDFLVQLMHLAEERRRGREYEAEGDKPRSWVNLNERLAPAVRGSGTPARLHVPRRILHHHPHGLPLSSLTRTCHYGASHNGRKSGFDARDTLFKLVDLRENVLKWAQTLRPGDEVSPVNPCV
ncbi:hypothetical protein DFH07DRAFT_993035 [Mycena maculata]|uniref:Uncharacterized protein n=1 Tax=Mycena maculata TaxID=230809 RepID=A0AAD7HXX6_9AGAR|nr:hypothetical protein DFH07DRAFT_993035 [Mycena maculata]